MKSCLCVCLGIPSTGCVKYLYIEKELIPAVWKVFLILVITSVYCLTGKTEMKHMTFVWHALYLFWIWFREEFGLFWSYTPGCQFLKISQLSKKQKLSYHACYIFLMKTTYIHGIVRNIFGIVYKLVEN